MKKFYLSLLAVAAISATAAVGSFALFTDTTNNESNTFSAGTVDLGVTADAIVNIDNIAPGDTGTGTVSVDYEGSLPAHIGVSGELTGDLTTCNPGKFTVTGVPTDGTTIQYVDDAIDGENVAVDVEWALDRTTDNDCQGKSADLNLTFHAVQSANNPVTAIEW